MSHSASTLPCDLTTRTTPPAWLAALPPAGKVAALRRHPLRGISVILHPYERGYGEALRALRNQPHNKLNLAQSADITAGQQRAWEDGYFARADDLCWVLLTPAHAFAGAVALYDITPEAAETGRLVVREEVARTSPVIAECELMVQWLAFGWLGLRRVTARIQPANQKMITMHERLGFVATGPSEIRGVPYQQFEVSAARFRPEPHVKVLAHWRQRATAPLSA